MLEENNHMREQKRVLTKGELIFARPLLLVEINQHKCGISSAYSAAVASLRLLNELELSHSNMMEYILQT